MPLVAINLRKGRPPEIKRAIADAVHAALVANLGIPETDRLLDPKVNGITLKAGLNQGSRSWMAPDTRSGNLPVEDPRPVLGRKVAPTRVRGKRRKSPISERAEVVQRLHIWTARHVLAPTFSWTPAPWSAVAITFGFSCFGFLASRFPRVCPLAIEGSLPRRHQAYRSAPGTVLADARE